MRVRLIAKPWFAGELYRAEFVNGESVDHVSEELFNKLKLVAGLEPQYIEEDCPNCTKLKKEIAKLRKKLPNED